MWPPDHRHLPLLRILRPEQRPAPFLPRRVPLQWELGYHLLGLNAYLAWLVACGDSASAEVTVAWRSSDSVPTVYVALEGLEELWGGAPPSPLSKSAAPDRWVLAMCFLTASPPACPAHSGPSTRLLTGPT